MTETVIILTEDAMLDTDAEQIVEAFASRRVAFVLLVPEDTERNVLVEFINDLGLLDLREMWDDIVGPAPEEGEAQAEAGEALGLSLQRLAEAGATAQGTIIGDDPVPALRRAVKEAGATDVIVVTKPKMLDDTFRRDWASRARDVLGVPVLHLYTGSSIVG